MSVAVSGSADEACVPAGLLAMGEGTAGMLGAALKVLSDPLRLRMVSAIAADPRGEACVCDLMELTHVAQPTVSHHLKKLKDAGVVESERRGTWVYYWIAPRYLQVVNVLLNSVAPSIVGANVGRKDIIEVDLGVMDARVERLAGELADEIAGLDRDIVFSIVRESHVSLARSARVRTHLIPLTERFARQRLEDRIRDSESAAPQVLFVCVANAGRSQIAAALTRHLSGGRVIARSAGSMPGGEVHPRVKARLEQLGGDFGNAYPKPLTDDAVRAADVVVTMGCGDVCPVIPGIHYQEWAVADPALASDEGIEIIWSDIEEQVKTLLGSLQPDFHPHEITR